MNQPTVTVHQSESSFLKVGGSASTSSSASNNSYGALKGRGKITYSRYCPVCNIKTFSTVDLIQAGTGIEVEQKGMPQFTRKCESCGHEFWKLCSRYDIARE